jgi:microcompartment protein CcmL/EutN
MNSLGLIEVIGFVSAVEASDVSLKAANVNLMRIDRVGGGIVTVSIVGDVGAVKAAVDAAKSAVEKMGRLRLVNVIPRLSADVEKYLFGSDENEFKDKVDDFSQGLQRAEDTIEEMDIKEVADLKEEVDIKEEADIKEIADIKEVTDIKEEVDIEEVADIREVDIKEDIDIMEQEKAEKVEIPEAEETSYLYKASVKELKVKLKELDPSMSTNAIKKMKKDEILELIEKLNREDK